MSERAAEQPPRPATHLQPENRSSQRVGADESASLPSLADDQDVLLTSLPSIEQAIHHSAALPQKEDEEERRAAENVLRLEADRRLVEQLRADGFTGMQFDLFQYTLAAYGIPVIRSWISRRLIYSLCASHGRSIQVPDEVREYLAGRDGEDDRVELAEETVAMALKMFKERALAGSEWSPEKGAALATYFIGACLLTFPNVFRTWYREYEHWKQTCPYGLAASAGDAVLDRRRSLDPQYDDDPADVAIGRALVLEHLHGLKDHPPRPPGLLSRWPCRARATPRSRLNSASALMP
ncbi:hypothetical protein [Amycolatopsis sp. NPDC003861]